MSLQLIACAGGAVQFPIPSTEKQLYDFQTEEDLSRWTIFTDRDYGGATTAGLQLLGDPEVLPSRPIRAVAAVLTALTRLRPEGSDTTHGHP